jgi:hypothetical protein
MYRVALMTPPTDAYNAVLWMKRAAALELGRFAKAQFIVGGWYERGHQLPPDEPSTATATAVTPATRTTTATTTVSNTTAPAAVTIRRPLQTDADSNSPSVTDDARAVVLVPRDIRMCIEQYTRAAEQQYFAGTSALRRVRGMFEKV